jgi:hypothetical protein
MQPAAVADLTTGAFQPVIGDTEAKNVRAVLMCSGKIAHELRAERAAQGAMDRAIVTIEQFYPFPEAAVAEALRAFPETAKIVWVQEEPANMGALNYVRPRLKVGGRHVTSIKRYESASPATGSAKAHARSGALINSPSPRISPARVELAEPASRLRAVCVPRRSALFPNVSTFGGSFPVGGCPALPVDCRCVPVLAQ